MNERLYFLFLLLIVICTGLLYDFIAYDSKYVYRYYINYYHNMYSFPAKKNDGETYYRTLFGYKCNWKLTKDFIKMNEEFDKRKCSVIELEDKYFRGMYIREVVYQC